MTVKSQCSLLRVEYGDIPYRTNLVSGEFPVITKDEIKKALKVMSRGKAAGEDGITMDLLKDGGDIVLEINMQIYTPNVSEKPVSQKNANIMLIHKKGDVKKLKDDRPISLLSVAYK